jgi:L-asparaginase
MHVRIITTGGTIDKVYFDAGNRYEVGEPEIGRILEEARVTFDWDVVSLMRKDSLELTDEDRGAIREAVASAPCERVLVTHGTDTMSATAEHLLGVAGKTVVLTGSLSPARFRNTDAVFNVGLAVGALQSLANGVYVAMNGCVFSAGRVRKNRDLNRFEWRE